MKPSQEDLIMARRRKLSPERKEFIDSLIAHYNPKDVSDVPTMKPRD